MKCFIRNFSSIFAQYLSDLDVKNRRALFSENLNKEIHKFQNRFLHLEWSIQMMYFISRNFNLASVIRKGAFVHDSQLQNNSSHRKIAIDSRTITKFQ